ncbi:MAG: cation:proton antiporter, partial [Phycisphaeraceae bacterium]|nr:cation:proton antiporter [Phycisphaeraceae bacterium]
MPVTSARLTLVAMTFFELLALLLTLAALFAWINAKLLRLPSTIAIMLLSLGFSLALLLVGQYQSGLIEEAEQILLGIDFNKTVMHGMLGFLLFAGALHVDLSDLWKQKWVIAVLASIGVAISSAIAAGMGWLIFNELFGLEMPLIYCLLFGVLITPTDPIAVLGILKKVGVGKGLETKITGESLFNDGVAVVLFITVLKIAAGDDPVTAGYVAKCFAIEVLGGAALGLAAGGLAWLLFKGIDHYTTESL